MKTYTIKEILDNCRIIIFIENKEQFDKLSNIKELKLTSYYMGSYCYNPHTRDWSSSSTKTYPGAYDSDSIIITSEQIVGDIPEKEENKPKVEVDKWYSFNWDCHSSNSTIIAKIKGVNEDSIDISWRSYLWRENDYNTLARYYFRDISNVKELSIEEVQQYLPEGHPDKFSNFNTSKYKMGDEEIAKAQFVTLDEAFVLPEKWCIKSNKDIDQILCKWRGGTHSLPPEENILTYQKCWIHVKYIEDFTEITFEQFKKYVLKEPEKMENASKDNLITRAVKTNNPQLIADELDCSIEEIIESKNSTTYSCAGNNFELLEDISCCGLNCTDDKCPFRNSNEKAISWLRGENKSVSPPESELECWLRETKAKNLSLKELENEINYKCSYFEVYKKLQGKCAIDKAQILYNEWNVKQEKDWTKATKEELLKEANRRYPKGTKFRNAASNSIHVSDGNAISWESSSYPDGIANDPGEGLFYANGKWAEIIFETDSPNVEATFCAETDKTIDFNFLPDPD